MSNKSLLIKSVSPVLTDDKSFIIVDSFNFSAVKEFHCKFRALNEDTSVPVIPIVITSYGGSVYALFAILDILKTSRKPISTIAMGAAMSCGSVLLSSGTKGYRFAGSLTDIMVHEVATSTSGKVTEITHDIAQSKKLNKTIFRIMAENIGHKDPAFFIKEMKKRGNLDWFLTAHEAKELGLIDHVGVPDFVVM